MRGHRDRFIRLFASANKLFKTRLRATDSIPRHLHSFTPPVLAVCINCVQTVAESITKLQVYQHVTALPLLQVSGLLGFQANEINLILTSLRHFRLAHISHLQVQHSQKQKPKEAGGN